MWENMSKRNVDIGQDLAALPSSPLNQRRSFDLERGNGCFPKPIRMAWEDRYW